MAHPVAHAPAHPVALVGECMVELQGQAFGTLQQRFGGDTLNTAVYLARCAGPRCAVHYATALGDDALSQGMMERWQAEGIELDLVRRLPGRMPGLYQIQTDASGERRFWYWRERSAAKAYFEITEPTPLEARALEWRALVLSGITLAILPPQGRERLFALMATLRARGALVVFDTNHRPQLWPDRAVALAAYERALALASLALVSRDDHTLLHGHGADPQALQVPELVVKQGADPTLVRAGGGPWQSVPTETVGTVVDTTAAGDSFAAGYLARRLDGASPVEAARFGNRLAARVVQHAGALIPRETMRDLMRQNPLAAATLPTRKR